MPVFSVPGVDLGRPGAGHGPGDGVRSTGVLGRDDDRRVGEELTGAGDPARQVPLCIAEPNLETVAAVTVRSDKAAHVGQALANAREPARDVEARKRSVGGWGSSC